MHEKKRLMSKAKGQEDPRKQDPYLRCPSCHSFIPISIDGDVDGGRALKFTFCGECGYAIYIVPLGKRGWHVFDPHVMSWDVLENKSCRIRRWNEREGEKGSF